MDEEDQHGHEAADRAAHEAADGQHVEKRGHTEHRVPEAMAVLVLGHQAGAHRRGDKPELERGFFKEGVFPRNRSRREPVAVLEHAVNRVHVDRLVPLEIGIPESAKERHAEDDDDENRGKPYAGPRPNRPQALDGRSMC